MEPLNEDVLNTLHEANDVACLCTVSKEGNPSGRFVKVTVSDDFTKLYVGNRKMNAAQNKFQNSHALFVVCDHYNDPLCAKSFQIDCTLENKRVVSENDPIYRKVLENTRDENTRPEEFFITNLINNTKNEDDKVTLRHYLDVAKKLEINTIKEILVFDIQKVSNSSLSRTGKIYS